MDVKKEICEFVSSNESAGALLLTGQWGCGKTYLIREIARELNNGEKYIVVTISLFGIETVEQLHKKVKENVFCAQILRKNASGTAKVIGPIKERIKSIAYALSEYSNFAKGINTALSINLYDFVVPSSEIQCYCEKTIISKKLVLVFDDFERCNVDSTKLLGAINEYSENAGIKTIIVADEKHIFGSKYNDFKEKVISRTVHLVSDYKNIITEIVKNYKETTAGYVEFLQKNLDVLIQIFSESKHENIRTFKTYIIAFERIYGTWKRSSIPTEKMAQILYSFGAIHFETAANNYVKHEKYGYMFAETNAKEKYSKLLLSYQLRPLQKWSVEGIWDEEELINSLRVHFEPKAVTYYEIFLNWDFWNLDDEIISKGLPDALELGYTGGLCCQEIISLLSRVQALNEYKIPLPCDVDYQKLLSGFRTREAEIKAGRLTEPKNSSFMTPEHVSKLCEHAQVLYKEIERMRDRKAAWEYRRKFIEYLKSPDLVDNSNLRSQSVVSFDDELLECFVSAYRRVENSEKRELYHTLNGLVFDYKYVSSHDDIAETVKNLDKLVKILLEMLSKEKDSFTIYIIEETTTYIKEMNAKIAEENSVANIG
ncbi:MAG: hypothetical protein IJE10_10980 [Clostridia bacterium]|nr:hypothetical protein [Clostridia bacterium]